MPPILDHARPLTVSSFWAVFWVDVSTEALAAADFFRIAESLQISAQTWRDVCRGLSTLQNPRLLVLDNADDRKVDYHRYFPSGIRGMTLVTSRNPELRQRATSRYLPLDELSDTAAQTLLLAAAGPLVEQHSKLKDDATKVARLLASHPLAIIQAGAYISRGHCTVAQYPQVYERQRQQLLRYRPSHAQSRYGDVYTTFEASADILQSSKDKAAVDALQLLPILATLSSTRLPLSLFGEAWQGAQHILGRSNVGRAVEGAALRGLTLWHVSKLPELLQVDAPEWDPFRLLEAMYLLKAFSLVTIETGNGDLNVSSHPLIHAWARDRQNGTEQHRGWLTSACLLITPDANHSYWLRQQRRLQPHVQALASWPMPIVFAQEPPELVVDIVLDCVYRLRRMDTNQASLSLMQKVCAHLGLDAMTVDGRWRWLYAWMADTLLKCDQPTEAVKVFEQILHFDEQTKSDDQPTPLRLQHRLAMAYDCIGKFQKALEILEDVVNTREQEFEGNDLQWLDLLASARELAKLYKKQGRTKDALVLMEQVVKKQEMTLDQDHRDRMNTEYQLAVCYAGQGLLREAYDQMQHVVDVGRRVLSQYDPNRLVSEHALAVYAWELGFREQGYDLMKHAVNVRQEILEETDPDRLDSENSLAVFSWELDLRDSNGYDLMNHVVSVQRRILDERHSNQLMSEHGLSIYSWEMGYRERAYTLMQHVVDIRRLTLAADNEDLVRTEGWIHEMESEMGHETHARRDYNSSRSSIASDASIH